MSAQKDLQGSETRELLEGTKENDILPDEVALICPPGKLMIFNRNNRKGNRKIELGARPDGDDSLCGVMRSDAWTCVSSRLGAPQDKRQAGPGVSSQFQPGKLHRDITHCTPLI